MKPPFFLFPDTISIDTVECLQQLLAEAKKGSIIGLAYAAMLKQRLYIVNAAGEAYRNPTFSRGMIQALSDKLGARIQGGNP